MTIVSISCSCLSVSQCLRESPRLRSFIRWRRARPKIDSPRSSRRARRGAEVHRNECRSALVVHEFCMERAQLGVISVPFLVLTWSIRGGPCDIRWGRARRSTPGARRLGMRSDPMPFRLLAGLVKGVVVLVHQPAGVSLRFGFPRCFQGLCCTRIDPNRTLTRAG